MSKEMVLSREGWKGVQQKLKALGFYSGEIDGRRGPLTDGAIISFKRSVGLNPRSFFGPLTYEALMKDNAGVSPYPWFEEARSLLGLQEKRDKSRLAKLFKSVAGIVINPAETPWCGAFVATCLRKWNPGEQLPGNPLGARQWGAYGERCAPQVGSILTFWRVSKSHWAGHVGFYAGEDATTYLVLGGNQSDSVSLTRIAKSRLLESRWPAGITQPRHKGETKLSGNISRNEA